MTLDLQALLADLGKASPRAKFAAFLGLVILVAGITLASVYSAKPHFVLLYSALDDSERVAVEKALASGRVSYRVSSPPAPFSVYVNDDQFDDAQIQVALAEALKRSPLGINSGTEGSASIFMSSGERAQAMLKREWQETERLLEQLEFVSRATVTSSLVEGSALRPRPPPTVSVALLLKGGNQLAAAQAQTVGKLVRFRFGVPRENVIITDQSGRVLYDESEQSQTGLAGLEPLEHAAHFDSTTAERVNAYLASAYGEDKVRVSVTSEWDFDHQTTVSETLDGESKEASIFKTETRTPQGEGTSQTAQPAASGAALATSKEETTQFEVPRQRLQTVRVSPVLKRLYVSLALDQSLAVRKAEVQTFVEAAVGFDSGRQDVIGVTTTDFAAITTKADAASGAGEGTEAADAAAADDSGQGMGELMKRGVEIVSALAFAAVLLMSLKKGSAAKAEGGAATGEAGAAGNLDVDAAALARARIDELVRSDPRRVGEILTRWAADETVAGKP